MPEPVSAVRQSPWHGLPLPTRAGLAAVADARPATRLVYRGDPALVGDAFGPALPTTPLASAAVGGRAALWLGPDEWLLLAPEAEAPALFAALAARLAGRACSLVDVGHRNAALAVKGPRAAWLLASGCPLDLDLAAFPVGMVARTLLAKAEVVLWRRVADHFHVEMQRSYAPYVAAWLAEAAHDLG